MGLELSRRYVNGAWRYVAQEEGGAAGGIQVASSISVTSAQVLACFATPVELIPAPGAGRGLVVVSATVETVGATVAYDGGTPVIRSEAGVWVDLTGQMTTDSDLIYVYAATAVSSAPEFFDGLPVVLTALFSNPELGTASLNITLTYYTFEFGS